MKYCTLLGWKVFSITEIIWKGKIVLGFTLLKIFVFLLLFLSFLFSLFCFVLFNNSAEWQMWGKEKENQENITVTTGILNLFPVDFTSGPTVLFVNILLATSMSRMSLLLLLTFSYLDKRIWSKTVVMNWVIFALHSQSWHLFTSVFKRSPYLVSSGYL